MRGGSVKRKAVGFYWTLPVPWVGFSGLSEDIEEAAQQSRTIRYQMERVRSWVADEGYDLVKEEVFLELAPDRGGEHVVPPLDKLAAFCRAEDATLLYVDFSEEQRWRSHMIMDRWVEKAGVDCVQIWPDTVTIDGQNFKPAEHFADWRARDKEWRAGKSAREAAAKAKADELKAKGLSLPAIAEQLNALGVASPTGKAWSGDNLRKLLKSA